MPPPNLKPRKDQIVEMKKRRNQRGSIGPVQSGGKTLTQVPISSISKFSNGAGVSRAQEAANRPGSTAGGEVVSQLKDRFGQDFRQKAYGDIPGYRPGIAKDIATATQAGASAPTLDALRQTLAAVKARRQELGVTKSRKPKPGGPDNGRPYQR